MAKKLPAIRTMEAAWNKQGKTPAQKRRLRWYYRNREQILDENRSYKKQAFALV